MGELLELIGPLIFVGFFLALGLFAGGWAERSHFKRLDKREEETGEILITQIKKYPGAVAAELPPAMFVGECVISSDYLKTFLASIRKFFGGEIKSYQTLLDRARREALLRIVEQAQDAGYNAVCNVRFENADVGGSTAMKKGMVMVAILATGTAYHRAS